jgi:hypothetical protein
MKKLLLFSTAVMAFAIGSAHAETFRMRCAPDGSVPYYVSYDSDTGKSYVTGSRTGFTRQYHAFDVKRIANVLYVAVKAPRQTRVLYLAFGYAKNGDDSSTLRVVDPGRSDSRDKCAFLPNVQQAQNVAPIIPPVVAPPIAPTIVAPPVTHRSVMEPEERHILLINNTNAYLAEIYVSNVDRDEWGDNIIYNPGYSGTGKPTVPGGTIDITITDRTTCNFDFRVVDSNHKGYMSRNVNVCNTDTLSIN